MSSGRRQPWLATLAVVVTVSVLAVGCGTQQQATKRHWVNVLTVTNSDRGSPTEPIIQKQPFTHRFGRLRVDWWTSQAEEGGYLGASFSLVKAANPDVTSEGGYEIPFFMTGFGSGAEPAHVVLQKGRGSPVVASPTPPCGGTWISRDAHPAGRYTFVAAGVGVTWRFTVYEWRLVSKSP